MSLDVAANVARQAMIVAQQQISISGRNIAAAGDPTRSRASVGLTTTIDGGVHVTSVRRAEDAALFTRMIAATSNTAEADAVLEHMLVLADTVGDPEDGTSVAALIGELEASIADYANAPDDPLFGQTVIEDARDLADTLNRAASELNLLREQADRELANSVDEVNRLLLEFQAANKAVTKAYSTGQDPTMDLDRRDAIVAELSIYMGISVLQREGGDMALFTDSGITLFDKSPRSVEFVRTPVYTVDTQGGVVMIDGMQVTGPDAPMPLRSGLIVGQSKVRDEVAPTYRLQLDEIARALETMFQDGIGSLFVTGGGPDYAGTIRVAAGVDPFQGGSVENLRDGTGNPNGYAAYSDRLMALGLTFTDIQAWDTDAELSGSSTLQEFATESVGWIEKVRLAATELAGRERAILDGASDALSRVTGVNMDDEYAQQLAIERNFAASARLITLIDEMFDELLRIF
ncbi:flagellar hook-associated protein FlgK [Acuticoccus sp. I52.16.1]|uniref:flagellar hook-associated protein FlgK n=1 Tax=Acuticoccus sp. I52.16.1 TaxID=2928472 RepID=UPI001FD4D61A|nr:flagellar hook-associated protein FlgK [Acuticoccus sp. I52.16.1]UOM34943.1 flagellar hook-associated protein FlgK [Acuticoccus sp. I52.16.1]